MMMMTTMAKSMAKMINAVIDLNLIASQSVIGFH